MPAYRELACDECGRTIDHTTLHIGFASSIGVTLCADCSTDDNIIDHMGRAGHGREAE